MRKWTQIPGSGLQDVALGPNQGTGVWVAGLNGTIWRQVDPQPFKQTTASGFRRIATSNVQQQAVWAVGANGTLWKTDVDWAGIGGEHWEQIVLDAARFPSGAEDACAGFDGRIWVVGKNLWLWMSADGGKHWEWVNPGLGIRRVAVARDGTKWAIFQDRSVWRGDEQGYWQPTKGTGMEDIAVNYFGLVWLVGANGTVWTTRDGEVFENLGASGFAAIAAAGEYNAYAVGLNGTLWHCDLNAPAPTQPPAGSTAPGGGAPTGGTPPAQGTPSIQVTALGAGKFHITGHGFLKDHTVWVRGVLLLEGGTDDRWETTKSSADKGEIDFTPTIPLVPSGATIYFSAHDGRPGPGFLGALFSNTVPVVVP